MLPRGQTARKSTLLGLLSVLCLLLTGCPDDLPRKPDPSKGTVSGIALCSDTGKPARFAQVQLLPAAMFDQHTAKNAEMDLDESATTGLDGRFTIEAVPPGDYLAYATLDGYLDPERGLDLSRVKREDADLDLAATLSQWRGRLIPITVSAQRTTNLPLELERGAALEGTVSYDDSSPAIGLRFQILRKDSKGAWFTVGSGSGGWSLEEKSDSRGHFHIGNLPAGSYKISSLLPLRGEERSPHIWLGGGLRVKSAEVVKLSAGETRAGVDIVIPLSGLHNVAGAVTVGADGHSPAQATVSLLYADDHELARSMPLRKDGSFAFDYVPQGEYLLRITGAQDAIKTAGASNTAGTEQAQIRRYQDKEMPLAVQSDMADVNLSLAENAESQPAKP